MNHLLELLMLKETNLEHSMYSTNNLTRTSGKARPTKTFILVYTYIKTEAQGAQLLIDSRQRGSGFEPHWRNCVVVLE